MPITSDARLARLVRVVAGCLIVAAQASGFAQEPALPSARDVVARHVTAMGGETAFRAVKSIRVRGTFEMAAQNITGVLETLSALHDKMLTRVDNSALRQA